MKTLIIVDVQKGFINDNNKQMLDNINILLKTSTFDKIIATRFVNSNDSQFVKFLNWNKMTSSPSIDFAFQIPRNIEVIDKTSYALPENSLDNLNLSKEDEVYICGTDYDACVLAIGFQLFDKKILPRFIYNCIGSASKHSIAKEDFKNIALRSFGKKSIIE